MPLKIHQPFFAEGISGDVGVVYHRTGSKALYKAYQILGIDSNTTHFATRLEEIENIVMPAIAKSGLIISPGMYGPPAVYNTYSLKSQLTGGMLHYGEFIVKSQTKLSHVLICDKDQAQKMFGMRSWTVLDQLALFGVPAQDMMNLTKDKQFKETWETYLKGDYLSSEVARYISLLGNFKDWVHKGIVKGLVYTGSNDGKCLIVYNHDLLIPRAYAQSAEGTKLESKWKPFEKLTSSDYAAMKSAKLDAQSKHKTTYDINDPDIKKARQLVSAIDKGDANSILDMLQQKYVSPFAYWNGQPFFFLIVERVDDADLMDYIAKTYNFNVNLKEKISGEPAIVLAMQHNHEETFKSLLKIKNLGPNLLGSPSGWGVLHHSIVLAARDPHKYLKYFEILVNDARVNVNLPTKDKRTPLDIINESKKAEPQNLQVIEKMELMLKKKGAK